MRVSFFNSACSPCATCTGPRVPRRAGGIVGGGCGIAAPGTTRDTLDWCQWRAVRGSARYSGWEACARPDPPPPQGRGGTDDNGEGTSQSLGAAPAPTGRSGSGSPRRGHERAEGADT